MAMFSCKLGAMDGTIVERDIEAPDAETLRERLLEEGYHVFQVRRSASRQIRLVGRRTAATDLIAFNQELQVLLKSGLPVLQALDVVLERLGKGALADATRQVREEIRGGAALSDAFERHPRVFPSLYVASIRAGERTGDLPKTIRRYVAYQKRLSALRKKFKSALVYPAFIVGVASIVLLVMFLYVVPTFSRIYADAGSALPMATQILIGVAIFAKNWFWLMLLLIGLGVMALRRWLTTEPGRYQRDALLLYLPYVGNVILYYSLTSFLRTFGTILGSGVPVVSALRMSVGTLNNRVLERRLYEIIRQVEEGGQLSTALQGLQVMPLVALRMISVGESTGALEEMLMEVSEHLEEELEGRLAMLTALVEPAIMIGLGLVLSVIIITLYFPIFKLAGTVSH